MDGNERGIRTKLRPEVIFAVLPPVSKLKISLGKAESDMCKNTDISTVLEINK